MLLPRRRLEQKLRSRPATTDTHIRCHQHGAATSPPRTAGAYGAHGKYNDVPGSRSLPKERPSGHNSSTRSIKGAGNSQDRPGSAPTGKKPQTRPRWRSPRARENARSRHRGKERSGQAGGGARVSTSAMLDSSWSATVDPSGGSGGGEITPADLPAPTLNTTSDSPSGDVPEFGGVPSAATSPLSSPGVALSGLNAFDVQALQQASRYVWGHLWWWVLGEHCM